MLTKTEFVRGKGLKAHCVTLKGISMEISHIYICIWLDKVTKNHGCVFIC